jgi:hypothetical protein
MERRNPLSADSSASEYSSPAQASSPGSKLWRNLSIQMGRQFVPGDALDCEVIHNLVSLTLQSLKFGFGPRLLNNFGATIRDDGKVCFTRFSMGTMEI